MMENVSSCAIPRSFTWGVPILGICYGCQLMAHTLGGQVTAAQEDYRPGVRQDRDLSIDTGCKLFQGLPRGGHLLDEPRRLYGQGARGLLP